MIPSCTTSRLTSASWIHWKLWWFKLLFLNQISTLVLHPSFFTLVRLSTASIMLLFEIPSWLNNHGSGGFEVLIIFLMCTVVLCSLCAHSASSFFPDFHCSNGFDYALSFSVVKLQTCTCVQHHFVFLPGCLCGLYTWLDSNLLQPSSVSTERSFLPCQPSVNATKTPLCLSLYFKTLSSYDAYSRKAVNLPLYQVLLS